MIFFICMISLQLWGSRSSELRIYPMIQAVERGESTSFMCYSNSTVQWYHKGRHIKYGLFGNTLFINDAHFKDNGLYKCVGYNSLGQLQYKTAILYVAVNNQKRITPEKEKIRINESAQFDCKTNKEAKWVFNGGPIHFYATTSGNLNQILVINNANLGNNGVYTCIGTMSTDSIFFATAKLSVYDNSKISPQQAIVLVGEPIVLTCESTDHIKWHLSVEEENVEAKGYKHDAFIKFFIHGCFYVTCEGKTADKNLWTKLPHRFFATTKIIVKEHVRVVPLSLVRRIGDDAVVLCHSNKTKEWKFVGDKMPSNVRIYNNGTKSYLIIEKANLDNVGYYVCNVMDLQNTVHQATVNLYIVQAIGRDTRSTTVDIADYKASLYNVQWQSEWRQCKNYDIGYDEIEPQYSLEEKGDTKEKRRKHKSKHKT